MNSMCTTDIQLGVFKWSVVTAHRWASAWTKNKHCDGNAIAYDIR